MNFEEELQIGEKKTILIIDDDTSILDIHEKICLENFDVEVLLVKTAEEAFKAITNTPPDLILCDLILPTTNGIEVTKKIKTDEKHKHIPIIIISGAGDKGNVILGKKAGADDFLVKPTPKELIVEKIEKYLQINRVASSYI